MPPSLDGLTSCTRYASRLEVAQAGELVATGRIRPVVSDVRTLARVDESVPPLWLPVVELVSALPSQPLASEMRFMSPVRRVSTVRK